jgi:hypothetical protein
MIHGHYIGQPLKSAPRNGKRVLLLLKPVDGEPFVDRFVVAYWEGDHWHACCGDYPAYDSGGDLIEIDDADVDQFFDLPQEKK